MSFSQATAGAILRPYLILALLLAIVAISNQQLPMPELLLEDRQRKGLQSDSAWHYRHTALRVWPLFLCGNRDIAGQFYYQFY